MYKGKAWTTRVKPLNVYNFYPLYDWRAEDIWAAVAKFDLLFNQVYELMYKNGVSIYEQRLCQPFGDDQRNGLSQYRALEFDTWERLLNRVAGVNFGNIYCKTALLGNLTTEKPEHMTWQQYAVFLLETIGLYAPELRDHYYKKIKTFIEWYEEQGISFKDFPEEADLKLEQEKKVPSWRRIARAIERNDFWMKRLSFSQTKSDVEEYFKLKKKYKNLAKKDETDDKHLRRLCDEENQISCT
jgi:predicted phosphoadenosine phosphosulfate sulfurtransferase